jgi:hypothetical protein
MVGSRPRTSCKVSLKKVEILAVPYQYTFSLINFIVNNEENFQTNSSVHSINTMNKHHIHTPNANRSCFQKSAFYAGNSLPLSLTSLMNEKAQFNVALRRYSSTHSFYSVDNFFLFMDDP